MAARLDGGTPDSRGGRLTASTVAPIGQDNDEHFLRFSTPSALPAIPDCGFLDDLPISPGEASANEKGPADEERMVEGGDEDVYPSVPILATLTTALMIAIFMIGLDTNIIGESIHFKVLLESKRLSYCKLS